jgi:hypothetical protein
MKASGQVLIEHYRCPAASLSLRLREPLSNCSGFFQFGSDITCYGRSSSRTWAKQPQFSFYDVAKDVEVDNGGVLLPFDPAEIIDNLRRERYLDAHSRIRVFAKDVYYTVRPWLSEGTRRAIQRAHARDWRELTFPHWPVDTTVEDICERVLLLSMTALGVDRIPFIWFWPNGVRGCVLMTHDVETETGRDFCPTLMDIDDAFGLKAAFQVVPEGRYAVPKPWLATIRERGFELAVQDLNHDGRLFDDREEFLRRAQEINRYGREWNANGFRAAILYRKPEWLSFLEFAFDMSIPNVAHLDPQRGGCCTVFPYFIENILELPVTTTQDYMLLNLLGQDSIELWKTQFERIIEKNGLASFIVHPDYVVEPKSRAIYESLLGYLRESGLRKQVWFALPSAIDQWWRARSKMQLVADGDSWRIDGDGAEQAVLAYARSDGDRLVYDLQMATA